MAERKSKLVQELTNLNEQFYKWVSEQHAQHNKELWIDGAGNYVKFANKLLTEYSDVLTGTGKDATQPNGIVSASAKPVTVAVPAPATSAPVDGLGGGGSSATSIGIFGNTSANAAWGGLQAAAAPGSITPAFAFSSTTPSAPPAFSFGASVAGGVPGAQAAKEQDDDDADEAQEEEPTEVEVPGIENIHMLYSGEAKLKELNIDEKKWMDKGNGKLTLRQDKSGSTPYIVFTSNSGKILLNARIAAKQDFQVKGKANNHVATSCLVASDDHKSLKPQFVILMMKTDIDAQKFADVCIKHKPAAS